MRALTCLLLAIFLTMLMPPTQAATDPAPARDGVWPLAPRPPVASRFDPPASRWGAGHRGVDLQGRAGQGVRTALAGTVTFAATLAGRGVVVVDHGGVRTTYEPVSASVHVGQHVGRGARIGTLQRASSHCFPGACLHWGLLRGETYLDPLTLVGGGPIRLLPLDGAVPPWLVP
jgi:murein DD-endopeptidase MepM/ murein hydrolase activator NlpD